MSIKTRKPPAYAARAAVAKALSHPTRLLLLDTLQEGERCVCELTELVGADQSVVSKHLAVLRGVGLVECRKVGTMSFYRVTAPCLRGFWECIDAVLLHRLECHRAELGI